MNLKNAVKAMFAGQAVCLILFLRYYFVGKNVSQAVNLIQHEELTTTTPPIVGRVSGCSLSDIEGRPNVVLLTNTNTGYVDMTLNMLASIRKAGVCVNTTIMAEDASAYQYLCETTRDDPAIHMVFSNFGDASSGKLMVFSVPYKKLVNRRHYYILSLLERGQEVLFIDADTFWFRDPFEYFHGNFDMSFVDERSPYPKRLPKRSLHCAGLGYFRPTNRTLRFVRKWISIIAEKKRPPSDQGVLNYMMHNDIPEHVDVRPLPLAFFPHALIYYKDNWNKKHNGTIIVHNVGLRGHDAKMNKFKANGMWLVNVTYNEIAQSFNQSARH